MHIFRGSTYALLAVALCNTLRVSTKQELACSALISENIDNIINQLDIGATTSILPASARSIQITRMMEPKSPHHAIVIPYRERLHNAGDFASFMVPYLTRNFPNATFSVYFVMQVDSGLFSRGFLLNAGLNEIRRTRPETQCVILHDIDLLPMVDGVPYDDCTYPIQLSSELEHFDWGVPYDGSCGGVISLHMNDWIKVNGMSNDYEGWGGEDDDLYIRLRLNGLLYGTENRMPLRPPKGKGRFSNRENASTISNENRNKGVHAKYGSNVAIVREMEVGSHRWRVDGLNDVAYFLVDHVRLVPKGASVHIVKVTGRTNCSGPKINVSLPCMKGISNKGPSSLLPLPR
jgi:N-terminal domain of galactosyltransferase/N-terminal region of glycosyl transferase group 7